MVISVVKLCTAALIPCLATFILYQKKVKTKLDSINYWGAQIIYGVIFGIIAIIGTEWGINMSGYYMNCRDAAPMVAGLIFGGPAGIIAGFIGGLERWFAVYWGAGEFTRVACTVSTCIAGIYGAFLRKYFFENKRPEVLIAGGCGFVSEVFHLSMVFFTNITDATKALDAVQNCFGPMVISVTVSVMISTFIAKLCSGDKLFDYEKKVHIFEKIQKHLLFSIASVSLLILGLLFVLQNNLAFVDSEKELVQTLDTLSQEILNDVDADMIETANYVKSTLLEHEKYDDTYSSEELENIASRYNATEISIIDAKKEVTIYSSVPEYQGFSFDKGEQSTDFIEHMRNNEVYLQKFQRISSDNRVYRRYVGLKFDENRYLQVGYDSDIYNDKKMSCCLDLVKYRKVGDEGGIVIVDENGNILSQSIQLDFHQDIARKDGKSLESCIEKKMYEIRVGSVDVYAMFCVCENYKIFAVVPKSQEIVNRDISVYVTVFAVVLIFAVLFAVVYFLLKSAVVTDILKLKESLSEISSGNLDINMDVRDSIEFDSLSDDINTTVATLKNYIDEAAKRIDEELEFAKVIQLSSLPSVYPPFPNKEFDIYATMCTAKEVGGDFFDFYMTDEDTLNFLIADVSGKGIPAAMFMMRSKAILKSTTERVKDIDNIFYQANIALCFGNDIDMFLTAWQGQLNIKTGEVVFISAGHNSPVIKHVDGKVEFVEQRTSFVLAGMEGVQFKVNKMKLLPGETLFLYTDGVTEATDANNKLYGDDKLLTILNGRTTLSLKEICDSVKRDIDIFVKDAPQFDDITMLALRYDGPQ